MGRLTVGQCSDSLGCLETNLKKLTIDQEYEPLPYIIILQLYNFGREVTFSIQVAIIATSNTPLNIMIQYI